MGQFIIKKCLSSTFNFNNIFYNGDRKKILKTRKFKKKFNLEIINRSLKKLS